MANVIEIIFKATDRVTGTSQKVEKSLGGLKKALGGIAVGAVVSATISKIVEATEKQQAAVAQLEATLKSTGGAAGRTSEQLQAQAAALQKVTTFGDEAIISMQSVLGTFTNIQGVNFDRATESILDVATKLKTDLNSAAIQVGKALNDPIKGVSALGRAGVQFSEDQQKLIKSLVDTGQTAKAQEIILNELQRQFEGSARAARNTLGGSIDALGNAFGDLFELTEEGTSSTVGAINELTETLQDPKTLEAAQALGGAIVSSLQVVVSWASKAVQGIQGLGVAVARAVGGVAIDDVEYYTEKLNRARKELDRFRNDPLFGPRSTLGAETELALLNDIIKAEEERNAAIRVRANITGVSIAEAAGNVIKPTQAETKTPATATILPAFISEEEKKRIEEQKKKLLDAITAGTSAYQLQREKIQENISVLDQYISTAINRTPDQLKAIGSTVEEYEKARAALARLNLELYDLDAAQINIEIPEIKPPENFDEVMQELYASTKTAVEGMDDELQKLGVVGQNLADGLQDAFVEFFMNMDKGFKGVLAGFVKLIQRMIAEALAAMAVKAILNYFGFSTAASGGKIFGINKMPAQSRPVVGRATGGMVPVRVGEEGPETAFLPVGTQIMNARQMAYNAQGGGPGAFNYQPVYDIRIMSSGDPRDIEMRLSMMLERRLAQHTQEIYTKMRNNGFGRLR